MHGVGARGAAARAVAETMPPHTAVLLLGHGSRAAEANEGMYRVVERLRERHPSWRVEAAFLEINRPSIPEGIDMCAEGGAGRIVLLPYFLHLGNHVQRDLPGFVEAGRRRHPGVEFVLGSHLGFHPKLVEIAEERLAEAVGSAMPAMRSVT